MPTPPEDDRVEKILSQVADALEQLNQGELRSSLMDGVRRALESIDSEWVHGSAPSEPDYSSHGGDGPDLRVVDTQEVERRRHDATSDVEVRLFTSPPASLRTENLHVHGAIELATQDAWQTVFRGESARAYRILADDGVLDIAVDGTTVERLLPGQSVDLEGQLLRTRCESPTGASGRYVRLP